MSVIIRLQGLAWSASAMDIRNFFKGLSIPPGGVRIIGGDNGDAFIAFSTDEDARQAMMLTTKLLNDCPVQLFLSSKTEMQNTITQAKDKTPATTAPVSIPPVSSNLGMSALSQQIPSVQQISQAFPAVGQIIGQLGLQQPAQNNQFQSGFQGNVPPTNITQTVNDKRMNQYEQELPGEYSVGGMAITNKQFDDRSNSQRQYVPPAKQNYENTTTKDHFRGEVFFPQKDFQPGSQVQPWENNYQQQNLNQNNQNMPFGNKQAFSNQSSNLSGHAGHGKPFHDNQSMHNSQQFGHGKPFHSGTGSINNQQSYQNDPQHSRQNDMSFPQGNPASEFSIPPRDQSNRNFPPFNSQGNPSNEFSIPLRDQSNRNLPPFSSQGDSNETSVSHAGNSNIPPRSRQSRFGPVSQPPPSLTSFPPRSRPSDTREKFQEVKPSTDAKPVDTPSAGLILSNKRDEFGRNVPYSRDGNLSDSSRTPTQDEKYEDNRSTDRARDSNRRSSRDRDRSRDLSNRRDSPRDRDRRDRDRDRGRRDRDDDRRSRRDRDRDREKDRDRERKPRDRDFDRYEKNRDPKEIDRKNSPASESSRKARKRSLSPNSKNKNDNEKKQQIEKPGQAAALKSSNKQDVIENKTKTSIDNQVSVSQSSLMTSKPLISSDEKKSNTGGQPLFPVIPAPIIGKGLLGEAPANLAPTTNTSSINLQIPPPVLNNLAGPNNTSFRNEGSGSGIRGPPLLNAPIDAPQKDFRGPPQGRMPLLPHSGIPALGMENIPSDRNIGQGMAEQPQTFEYGHSGGMMVPPGRDMTINNRPDFRGPREAHLNANLPPSNFRGPGRGIPPPAFIDDQQRPGFSIGPRGRLDSQPRFFNDQPTDDRNRDRPFENRRPRDFRGPPPGREGPPGRDVPPQGSNQPRVKGQESRPSLLGDGGIPRDFQRQPSRDGFHERPLFDERDAPNFQRLQGEESFQQDLNEFQGPYDDRRANDTHGVPSLLDDIPFGGRRDLQDRSGRDVPRGRDDHLSDFRERPQYEGRREESFRGDEIRNRFGPSARDDRGFRGRDFSNDVSGPRDIRGRGLNDMDHRDYRGPQVGGRGNREQDFDRVPNHMRDTNMDPPNSRDTYREDDRNRIQSERDRDRRTFDRDGPSVDRDRSGFDRRERYDNRDNRSYERHQDKNPPRDRANERSREDRNTREDRNREQYGDRNERGRQSLRDDRKGSESDDRRSYRGDDRSSDRKPSTNNIKTEPEDKQSDNKDEIEKSTESIEDTSVTDSTKVTALCSVVMENIPVETTYKDIRKLFAGLELPKDGIKIINDKYGKRIGKAYIRFGSQDSFKKGLQKDRTRLGYKVMVIKPVPRKEFDSAVDSYLPPSEDDDDDDGPLDRDMCNSLSATLRALKGEPELKISKKGPSSKDFVVKLTLLPEYTKAQNIKTFFQGLDIAQNGDAIYIEPGPFNKPCSGLCYVEFTNESSFKNALNQKKTFERKTINITQASKKDAEHLMNKQDTERKNGDSKQDIKNTETDSEQISNKTKADNEQDKSNESVKTTEVKADSNALGAEFSKKTPVKSSAPCTCLRIQNIPKGLKVFELRTFFETVGVSVKVSQICHDAVGKPIGEGYIELASYSDVQKCLVKNQSCIGQNRVTVEPVTKTEMIENMRLLRQSLQPETPTTKAVYFFVKSGNLPRTVSTGEIMNFFSGFNPAPESIRLNIGDGNEPQDCSTALVGFRTREEAETAINATNGNLLRNKNVVLTKVIL